ncbi:hypothetical protein BDP81DRAFT_177560 [Colletotrichum phormii]|uniref:Uncharacterized protein n=1 Tax=Colletotrichum phormii TaxID=359342 RepID=A0AAJ0EJW9_9PEZI|nr:uncharacterized protein BDP81DRAFT_177560 [Colletotrichum phormii]KAK1639461.1 hypothetical protein BDP81DRAFT_177560 [Colletotrichum phormii]
MPANTAHRPEARHHRHTTRLHRKTAIQTDWQPDHHRRTACTVNLSLLRPMSRLLNATQQPLPASHASPECPTLQDVDDLPPRQPRSTFLPVGSPITHHPNNRFTHSPSRASSKVSPLLQTFVSSYHQRQYVPPIYFPMRHHLLLRNPNWVPPTTAGVPTLLCGVLP